MRWKRIFRWLYYGKAKRRKICIRPSASVTDCTFEEGPYCWNRIGEKTYLKDCSIGIGTYMGDNCKFRKTIFGRYCAIGHNVQLLYGEHPTSRYVSIHPAFYSEREIAGLSFHHRTDYQEYRYAADEHLCIVGSDVWIGSNVNIVSGVKIGNGAIVAGGALVTKNVPDYAVVGGCPAKVIKYRFTPEQIDLLNRIRWWEREHRWIEEHIELFDDVGKFVREVKWNAADI